MSKALFFHAACPVCVCAERQFVPIFHIDFGAALADLN